MEKLKYIKIEHEDGTLSENVPIGVDANNVDNGNETLDTTLASMNNRIATAISSSEPQMVSSTSQMTDQNKMYVLSSSNTIYYYNNGVWTNSNIQYTPSLTTYLGRKNNNGVYPLDCSETGIYYLGSSDTKPANWPINNSHAAQILHFEGTNYQKTWELLIPYEVHEDNCGEIYVRDKDYSTGEYRAWQKIGQSGRSYLKSLLYSYRALMMYPDATDGLGQITSQEEFDNARTGFYFIGSASGNIEGIPDTRHSGGMLLCFDASQSTQHVTRTYQLWIPYLAIADTPTTADNIKVRNLTSTGWTAWRDLMKTDVTPTPVPEEPRNTIIYNSSEDRYEIKFGDASCYFRHQTGTQWDIWHPQAFALRNTTISASSGQDFTGPIKEEGASDYCSGIHGEEIDQSVIIEADGQTITTANTTAVSFNSLNIYKKTKVYSDIDKTTEIADRYINYIFTDNDLQIYNKFVFTKATNIISSCVAGLGSVYDEYITGIWMNGSGIRQDNTLAYGARVDNTIGRIYLTNGIMEIKNIEGWTSNHRGSMAHFTNESRPRHKIYFKDDTLHSYAIGDELKGASEIKFY